MMSGFSVAGFLELVNNMLTSGMVPALFPDDEKEQIIGQVEYTVHFTYKAFIIHYVYVYCIYVRGHMYILYWLL